MDMNNCKVFFSSKACGDTFSGSYAGRYTLDEKKFYLEFYDDGEDKSQTQITLQGQKLIVKRKSFAESYLPLEKGKQTVGYLTSPYGQMEMGLKLINFSMDNSRDMIRLKAEYQSVSGGQMDKNQFTIIVKEQKI